MHCLETSVLQQYSYGDAHKDQDVYCTSVTTIMARFVILQKSYDVMMVGNITYWYEYIAQASTVEISTQTNCRATRQSAETRCVEPSNTPSIF